MWDMSIFRTSPSTQIGFFQARHCKWSMKDPSACSILGAPERHCEGWTGHLFVGMKTGALKKNGIPHDGNFFRCFNKEHDDNLLDLGFETKANEETSPGVLVTLQV